MNEGFNLDTPVVVPTLEELDNVSGREIEGIESKQEKFLKLKEGEDFEVIQKNEKIVSDHDLADFMVFISPSTGEETKTVEAPHWRAINDSNVHSSIELNSESSVRTKEYFYGVSTKGIGYLKPTAKNINIEDYDSWTVDDKEGVNDRGYKVLGLISKEEAVGGSLIEKSERLVSLGLRTELYWGMSELKRIPYKGKLLTVDELRKLKVISPRKDYVPYEVVRLFKMNNRIAEASKSDERRTELFKNAFDVFNKEAKDKSLDLPEISIGNPDQEKIFFAEFFKRMGKNMATLLNNGLDHGYMHSANVTLAAEIADVGTIDSWKQEKNAVNTKRYGDVRRAHLKDMRDMCYGIRMLLKAGKQAGLSVGDREDLRDEFFAGFNETFIDEMVTKEKTDPKKAKEWMKKIFDKVIVEGGNLPALLHYDVEDWDISVE